MEIKTTAVIFCTFFLLTQNLFAKDLCSSENLQDLIKCASDEFNKDDAALNLAYQNMIRKMARLGSDQEEQKFIDSQKKKLVSSQKKWIEMRDEYCSMYDLLRGGAERPVHQLGCLSNLTRHRTDELNAMLSGLIDNL